MTTIKEMIRQANADGYVDDNAEAKVCQDVVLKDMSQMQTYAFSDSIRVAGIIVDESLDEDSNYSLYGYSTIYASETVSNELLISMMAARSKSELNFGGTKVVNDYDRAIFSTSDIPDGEAYIFEDQTYYYKDEKK